MPAPTVTVLIDTYNHERFIEEAIGSVLEQDFPLSEVEILVVDDGSKDRTPDLVRRFEPRVKLLEKANGGQASAFNIGLREARGEIVAFLDGDDWWARNKLARVITAMRNDRSIGILGHGIIIVDRDGSRQTETLREGFRFQANTLNGAKLLRRRGAFLGTSRMTIRRDLLQRIGAVPESIGVQADEYLFTLSAVLAQTAILPEPLTYYRYHESNAFQISHFDEAKLRHKQKSLAALAESLSSELKSYGIDEQTREAIIEYTRASADQLHLILEGGLPWRTARTEWKIYAVLHPDASVVHRAFKMLTLLAALVTTPRAYYAAQRRIARSALYLRARQRYLPVPEMPHIRRESRS